MPSCNVSIATRHKAFKKDRACGFSLVELMVALLFTLFLMSGLASVFKSSLTAFYTSGESVSSSRRNRLSIDLLAEDINMAGMYLTDMTLPPYTVRNTPPFYIVPNATVDGAGADDPKATDELYFYLDEPLPFEGVLRSSSDQQTAASMVLSGGGLDSGSSSYTVDCLSSEYAKQVEQGHYAVFKDFWEAVYIASASAGGQNVEFTTGPSPNAGITGSGSMGLPARVNHLEGAGVLFVKSAQMVQYRIEMIGLDPARPEGVPCLVRYQGDYPATGGGFDPPDGSRQIITENVSGFKVYLSANGGADWAGFGSDAAGFDAGWDGSGGIRGQIDSQLSSVGRPGFKTTRFSEHWFRSVPILVRVDITTRTATKRAEFSAANDELAYRELTQTLIFVPRHFGLTMN